MRSPVRRQSGCCDECADWRMLTQRKNKMVTRHSGYMDARNDSSAALVLVVLPCLRDMRLKMAMMI